MITNSEGPGVTRKRLLELIGTCGDSNFKKFPDGGLLIGSPQSPGEDRWCHIVFPPIADSVVVFRLRENRHFLDFPYVLQLREFNSIDLFRGDFALFGIRVEFRSGNLPYFVYDIVSENIGRDSFGASRDKLIIGATDGSRSSFLIQDLGGRVEAVHRESGILQATWPDFRSLIESEIERLQTEFG
jgi:hypothetical protein